MASRAKIPLLRACITELEAKLNGAITESSRLQERLKYEVAESARLLESERASHKAIVEAMKDAALENLNRIQSNHAANIKAMQEEHAATIAKKDNEYKYAVAQITRQAEAISEVHTMLDQAGAPPIPEGKNMTTTIVGRLGALFMWAALRGGK